MDTIQRFFIPIFAVIALVGILLVVGAINRQVHGAPMYAQAQEVPQVKAPACEDANLVEPQVIRANEMGAKVERFKGERLEKVMAVLIKLHGAVAVEADEVLFASIVVTDAEGNKTTRTNLAFAKDGCMVLVIPGYPFRDLIIAEVGEAQ